VPLLLRLSRILRARLTGWRLPLLVAVFVFLSSWLAMALAEPSGSDITAARNYWWYFIVTAATVGYGDLFPDLDRGPVRRRVRHRRRHRHADAAVHAAGRLRLQPQGQADARRHRRRPRRPRRAARLHRRAHERILRELTSEGRLQIVLCAFEDDVAENPVPEQHAVHFVRGDLTRADVMARAAVARARTAVVDGRDDNETLAIAVAVAHAAPDIHLVAALRDLTRREQLSYVNRRVQCVQWHMPFLLTEEATDPGITQVYNDLMSSGGHGNTYSATLPAGFPHRTVGGCQEWLGRTFGATLLAVRDGSELVVSPPWDAALPAGTTVYYVASSRIDVGRAGSR
jgi:voltage-gated potassium channel